MPTNWLLQQVSVHSIFMILFSFMSAISAYCMFFKCRLKQEKHSIQIISFQSWQHQQTNSSPSFLRTCICSPFTRGKSINAWRRSNARCENTLRVSQRSHILLAPPRPFESECDPWSKCAAKAKAAFTVSVALIERDRGAACLYSQPTYTLA